MTTLIFDDAADFKIEYDGPALVDHAIPVRDLAPALLALGEAFDRANVILNGNRSSVVLEVRATEQASFEVVLSLKQVIDGGFISPDFLTSAAALVGILVGGPQVTMNLMGLLRRLKGRKPNIIERTPNTITIEIDGEPHTFSTQIIDLYEDGSMRARMEAVVRPLGTEGITTLNIKVDDRVVETVVKSDVPAFQPPIPDNATEVTETIIPAQRLQPSRAESKPGNKWRMDGWRQDSLLQGHRR